ncbi:MAG TPA: PHP domain-containing protein [Candidatus Limnocylindrales bacterium]
MAFAELHCHSHFSFLDGASAPDELVERAVELGLDALAVTDHQGLYGAVRFSTAAREAGLHAVVGLEIELLDAAVPDPFCLVVPAHRAVRGRRSPTSTPEPLPPVEGAPARPRPDRARLPGHRSVVKEDARGVGEAQRGPHLVLLAASDAGYRSLCRLVSRANLAGTKAMPRFSQALLAEHVEGVVALSGCRDGELARRLRAGDRAGARAVAERYARSFGRDGGAGFYLELQHHLLPDDDWLVAEAVRLAAELGLPVVVTNDVHYARPEGRELQDVLTAIRHGRSLDTLADLRRPDGESYLKSAAELLALPPGDAGADPAVARAWAEGIRTAGEVAARCSVDLAFERYRFPGFPVPKGETAFSHLEQLCHEGVRRRYHPVTPTVVRQLAHELDVIERTGLAEFFLICWDLMRFARERGIPAQGRGSAADSIVAYVLGITRVDPIRHNLLFERFINEGRTTYPDVDIDFSSERREEVIQYVYGRYGTEHTGMVCNLVTYRARSAVREVGYALGFPRPLVDRVAKALETYDSVMVRRDLEAEGGFGQFFARSDEEAAGPEAAVAVAAWRAGERGLVDSMGQLRHERGGRIATRGRDEHGDGRLVRREDVGRTEAAGGSTAGGRSADDRRGDEAGLAPRWAAASRPSIRSRGPSDDEGGPGDSAASVAWLRREPQRRDGPGVYGAHGDGGRAERPAVARSSPEGISDAIRGAERPSAGVAGSGGDPWGRPTAARSSVPSVPRLPDQADPAEARDDGPVVAADPGVVLRPNMPGGHEPTAPVPPTVPHSSVARLAPPPEVDREAHRGSTVGLSDWERWLELCARLDGFPRHLSIHTGGMLVTAAPLIDIAPLERATMPGRVVVQYDKRDVETIKLIKLDLLGLGMLAAIDETLQLIEHDCATCVDLDRLPEEIPEVFEMLRAADTVGVFQVESRAQMQTLPKSRPASLDDLVVEVAIIRPGPIQGNAVHPYLRRRQGLEPVEYLHPSLEPILRETLGVILYQEQVMQIAIGVAGFSAAESDGFRRAMGTWRSSREMEKLHRRFVDGCRWTNGLSDEQAEELFRQVAAFASFGFAKSHAAAFARTAYESAFLKLFYQAQFTVGLINAQPMGFYPVEVLVNDAKRHGVAVLPVDVNASAYRTTTEWVGPDGQPRPVESAACVVPSAEVRGRWSAESAAGWAIRLGLQLVKGIGEEHQARLDAELARGSYRSLAEVVDRTGLPEEVVERLIRAGALDSLGRPRRELLWQLREVMGATRGRVDGRDVRRGAAAGRAAGRPMDLRLPATAVPPLPALTELERTGDAYAVLSLDARRQVVSLFRPALERLGAVTNGSLASRRPGPVRLGGLVVTRQHPMTARGTVFLALEDETGMVNVTLWPAAWTRLRGVVRRHALLYLEGDLQREGDVVNVVARDVRPLPDETAAVGGPARPEGVRSLGYAGMRRG